MLTRVDDAVEPPFDEQDEAVAVDDVVVRTGFVRQVERDAAVVGSTQTDTGMRIEPASGALGRPEDLQGPIGEADHRAIVAAIRWRAWEPGRIVRG